MSGISRSAVFSRRDESCGCILHRSGAAHHPEAQETVVRHAYTHSSAFEKVSHGIHLLIALSFQIITFLRFGCILACVLAGTVGPIPFRELVKAIKTKAMELGTRVLMHPAPIHFFVGLRFPYSFVI